MWWFEEVGPLAVDQVMRTEPSQMGFVLLLKETLQSCLAPSTSWGHSEKGLWARKQTGTHHPPQQICWHLILDLSTSRTVKNTFLLLINYQVCGICYSSSDCGCTLKKLDERDADNNVLAKALHWLHVCVVITNAGFEFFSQAWLLLREVWEIISSDL